MTGIRRHPIGLALVTLTLFGALFAAVDVLAVTSGAWHGLWTGPVATLLGLAVGAGLTLRLTRDLPAR